MTRPNHEQALWSARKERLWSTAVYSSSFIFIVLVTAEFIYAKSTTSVTPAREVAFVGGQVSIPMSEVSDGELHRYSANLESKKVFFVIFKKPDGKVVTVLDACQICGPVGFYKSGNQIICSSSFEWSAADEHFVKHDAETENVAAYIYRQSSRFSAA